MGVLKIMGAKPQPDERIVHSGKILPPPEANSVAGFEVITYGQL
jgi:hypothetical protein